LASIVSSGHKAEEKYMNSEGQEDGVLIQGNGFVLHIQKEMETVLPGVYVLGAMGNAVAIETEKGFVQVDTGMNRNMALSLLKKLREIRDAPVHTIIYSHGHNGYNQGAATFLSEAQKRGDPLPRVLAHERLPVRYRRYRETAALQARLNSIQFRLPLGANPIIPEYVFPDVTFKEILRLDFNDRPLEVHWAPSETDDSLAVWLPRERVLYTGPAVIWACINVGTPLRTQRDAVRWAETLDKFMALRPEILIPSYGPTLHGAEEIQKVLGNMADGLRYLRREVVERMNRGMTDVEIIHDLTYPPEYFKQPWSAPIYGCPEYIVRDIYRSENGWWNRNPTDLHPARPELAAQAVLEALGDRGFVLEQARVLRDAGEVQLALHVVDLLSLAQGDEKEVVEARKLKAELLRLRSKDVPSIVSANLYLSTADRLEESN
jgi:alkyl sulfatase BDS1-like metallo-beta-lactamase superfamily hydrolase